MKKVKTLAILRKIFDVVYVAAILLSIILTGQIFIALLLVVLMKWRIFMLRFKYFGQNLLSNSIDLLIGFSFVFLIWQYSSEESSLAIYCQIFFALLYLIYLMFIKVGVSSKIVFAQALIAQFVSLWAILIFVNDLFLPLTIGLIFLVGFLTARHIVVDFQPKDKYNIFVALIWGIILAEIGFFAAHWIIGYSYFNGLLVIPQFSLVSLFMGILTWSLYESAQKQETKQPRWVDFRWPALFSVFALLILGLLFSGIIK